MFNVVSIRPSKSGKGLVFESAKAPVAGSKIGRVATNYAFAELAPGVDLAALAASLDVAQFKIANVVDGLGELIEL